MSEARYESSSSQDEEEDRNDWMICDEGDSQDVLPAPSSAGSYDEAKSLSMTDVSEMMESQIQTIVEMIALNPDAVLVLLREYGWDSEKLIEDLLDNRTKVQVDDGLQCPDPSGSSTPKEQVLPRRSKQNPADSTSPFVCPVCCGDEKPGKLALQCGHQFCEQCWVKYLEDRILKENDLNIRCMQHECNLLVLGSFIHTYGGGQVYYGFQDLLVRDYIAHTAHLRFCPISGCTEIIACRSAATRPTLDTMAPIVQCSRGDPFCFGCGITADHRPAPCQVAEAWLKCSHADTAKESMMWIYENTKMCPAPHCRSIIEKNGGCSHMTCSECKHEFCWVCMGPWRQPDGPHTCTCYTAQSGRVEIARRLDITSNASTNYYTHYFNRWSIHAQSARLSTNIFNKAKMKMDAIQLAKNSTWVDVQYMTSAVEEVLRCRRTLKWTYAMAYHLRNSSPKELFEEMQRDLDNAVENLCELLESPVWWVFAPEFRSSVINKTAYLRKRNEIVLKDTAKGFEESRWAWNAGVE